MAVTFNSFIQPENQGNVVGVDMVGDPVLNVDAVVRFIKYGQYRVIGAHNGETTSPFRHYDLQLMEKYSSDAVPAGTAALVEPSPSPVAPMAYNSTIFLNFKEPILRTLLLTGNIVFAAQQHVPGGYVLVRMRNTTASTLNLTFPTSWIFLSAKPTTIATGRTAELSIRSYAKSDADVIAYYSVQA